MRSFLGKSAILSPACILTIVVSGIGSGVAALPAVAQDILISEVLAANSRGIVDEDGDSSDWIEICNRGPGAADLDGYYLTDDLSDLRRWRLPAVTLETNGYLVVFASGKDRADAGFELHTNFRVSGGGEDLALVAPDGRSVLSSLPLPRQRSDVSFGILGNRAATHELVSSGGTARLLAPVGEIDPGWRDLVFRDSQWDDVRLGIGYDVDAEGPYLGAFETDVGTLLRERTATALVRAPFFINDLAALETLTLWMRCDDGFIVYLNGTEVARENAPAAPAWDATASTARTDIAAVGDFIEIDLTARLPVLVAGPNILAIHALNSSAAADRFLLVPILEARIAGISTGYFTTPSPGAPNGDGLEAAVDDTSFSVDRGFYDSAVSVVVTTNTPDAVTRYTLDGSAPSSSHGTVYTGPLSVRSTTVLRAMAYRPGYLPTNVDTHTYFSSASQRIRSLRVISIAGDPVTTFSTSIGGLYENPLLRGIEAERPVSVEFFDPRNGSESSDVGKQRDGGIRLHGSSYRRRTIGPNPNAKWSFRLYSRGRYDGQGDFVYPLIDGSAVESNRVLNLRGGYNDSSNPFIKDELGRRLYGDMGNVVSLGTVVNLFINGRLKNNGYYNPAERYGESLFREKFGSDESWDVVTKWQQSGTPADPPRDFDSPYKFDVRDGDHFSFEEMLDFASGRDLSDAANYEEIAGRLYLPGFVDYLLIQGYTRIRDWPHNNWVAARERSDGDLRRWRFYPWDLELGWRSGDLDASFKTPGSSRDVPLGVLFSALLASEEFRLLFADRAQKHLIGGGALDGENVIRRYEELRSVMSAVLPGMNTFLRDTWAPQRPPRVISSLSTLGLFTVEGPRFSVDGASRQQGGAITEGSVLTIRNPPASPGTVYYTLDGADPRLSGGALNPDAGVAAEGSSASVTLLPLRADVRVSVPEDGGLGLDWTQVAFDDRNWTDGETGVGYERQSGYEDLISTDVEASMFGVNASVYLRVRFEVEDPSELSALVLRMRYDDGFVAYLNGERIAARNAPASPGWDSTSSSGHADAQALVAEEIAIPDAVLLLVPGENVLAVHGMNVSDTSSDLLILPELRAFETGGEEEVNEIPPLLSSTLVRARSLDGEDWSALSEAVFVVDSGLRITEVMYHPAPPPEGSPFERDEFEFVELTNTGDATIDLTGVRFVDGIEFDFTGSGVTSLLPGEVVVIVENLQAFASRYNFDLVLAAGQYLGKLANDGERVLLVGALGETLHDFEYVDSWYPSTDGLGPSLVVDAPSSDPETWGDAATWRASGFQLGSPGIDESGKVPTGGLQRIGDLNQDGRLDVSDPVAILRYLFLGDRSVLPCGDGTLDDPANLTLLDVNGDGAVDVADSIGILDFLFTSGPLLALGYECTRVEECDSVCVR